MIPAVAQTLAEMLAGGRSLINTEQIDFNHPNQWHGRSPRLNLYCYEIRENQHMQQALQQTENPPNCNSPLICYDLSFIPTSWGCTALGEQYLLSEALTQLLPDQLLPEGLLTPALQEYGMLPLKVAAGGRMDTAALWNVLEVPLNPALDVTVTVPLNRHKESLLFQEV